MIAAESGFNCHTINLSWNSENQVAEIWKFYGEIFTARLLLKHKADGQRRDVSKTVVYSY